MVHPVGDEARVEMSGAGVVPLLQRIRYLWLLCLFTWGMNAVVSGSELPANPPPGMIHKPPDPGPNLPHMLDRSTILPQDMSPQTQIPSNRTIKDVPPVLVSNAELLAELRRQDVTKETYPAAQPMLVSRIQGLAKEQDERFGKLLSAGLLHPNDREILERLGKIDLAALKPQEVEITAGRKLKVLTCASQPEFGLRPGNLVGVWDQAKKEHYAVLGIDAETSPLLRIIDAEPLSDATFVAPGNRKRAAENTLESVEIERLDPNVEFAPEVLHYWFSGSTGRVHPPYRTSHVLPQKGIGLILFRPGVDEEVTANLVSPGFYAFRFDSRTKRWGLVRKSFRATIDNTGRPAPFRFVLDNAEELMVPPLEVVTFAVMNPKFEVSYRRNRSTSLAPITERLRASVWKVVSDPVGDTVRIDEDPQGGREFIDIKGPDRVIFRNPRTSIGPATFDFFKKDTTSGKVELLHRVLDPGELTYILAQSYLAQSGGKTEPSVLIEPSTSSQESGITTPISYRPGVYHFDETAVGDGQWSPPSRADEFITWVSNLNNSPLHFIARMTGSKVPGNPGKPIPHMDVRLPIPIAIEYDPGDGQGIIRQPLDSTSGTNSPPSYVVGLDPTTNLLKLKRVDTPSP